MQAYARVLVRSACCNKNIIDWVAYKQQTFMSHRLGAGKAKILAPADSVSGEDPLHCSSLLLCPRVQVEG